MTDEPSDKIFTPGERGPDKTEGATSKDWFGVRWTYTKALGGLSGTVATDGQAIDELSQWREKNVIPTQAQIDAFDWEGYCANMTKSWDRERRVSFCYLASGFFQRMHHVVPFEEAMCAFYDDPDEVHAFLDALLAYHKAMLGKIKYHANPDVVIYHDDYGTANSLFISKELWLEFIAPRLRELIRYCHEIGYIFEMHSCGYVTPLIEDMVEMGIDVLQPLQAMNDVKMVKERFGDKIILHGGITASQLVAEGVSRQQLDAAVQKCVDICAPDGRFIVMLSECGDGAKRVSDAFARAIGTTNWEYISHLDA